MKIRHTKILDKIEVPPRSEILNSADEKELLENAGKSLNNSYLTI